MRDLREGAEQRAQQARDRKALLAGEDLSVSEMELVTARREQAVAFAASNRTRVLRLGSVTALVAALSLIALATSVFGGSWWAIVLSLLVTLIGGFGVTAVFGLCRLSDAKQAEVREILERHGVNWRAEA